MKLRKGFVVFVVSLVTELLLLIWILRFVDVLPMSAGVRFFVIIFFLMVSTGIFVYENVDFPPDEEESGERDYR